MSDRRPPGGRRERVRLLLLAVGVLTRVELVVRRRPLPALCQAFGLRLEAFGAGAAAAGAAPAEVRPLPVTVAHRWWALEHVLTRWPWGRSRPCLRRSLALGSLLAGLDPALRLEIRTLEPFCAHAFVVVRGQRLDVGQLEQATVPAVPAP